MTRSKRIYRKWTFSKRKNVEELCGQEYTGREIAEMVGMSHTTICRELQRCPKGRYSAEYAQKDADIKKQSSADSNRRYRKEIVKELTALQERVAALERRNPS